MAEPQQPSRPVLPMEMEKSLSIREYEQRTEALKAWIDSQFAHVREVADINAKALKMALELKAAESSKEHEAKALELARRLEELNHAHKTAMENWARSLPRELFEGSWGELTKWRDSVNAALILNQQTAVNIADLAARTVKIEAIFQRTTGVLVFLGLMGASGVAALAISLLRLAGAVK